ncbi:asparagine synthase-related protein [Actinacidiphila glaucinigra]|uniref:asparagine synthase-related protein n=1 Tax=Actinacidiphila glaucinigra TaxID=235986 RepID=UPI0037C7DBC2
MTRSWPRPTCTVRSDDTLERRLLNRVRALGGSIAVAYSGGVDSALVLAAAARALGPERVLTVTAVSESLADGELSRARRLADDLGIIHLAPHTNELSRPDTGPAAPTAATSASPRFWTPSPRSRTTTASVSWPPAPMPMTQRIPTVRASAPGGNAASGHRSSTPA